MTLRNLPAVNALVQTLDDHGLPRLIVTEVARQAIDEARAAISDGHSVDPGATAEAELSRLSVLRPTRVINATGVIIHTNLGRVPVSPDSARAATDAATTYGNLEFDLSTGARGGRGAWVEHLLRHLTGAEAAMVVNNNAASLLLALAALATGKSVPVSRGELIEIGGSYRLPDLMGASGAVMVEVGTTNRTRPADYAAVAAEAAFLLKVHPSNYRVDGFTQEASIADLVAIGKTTGVPVVFDAGSGLLDETTPWLDDHDLPWLAGEPGIRQAIDTGADLVMFSGDKLLGGPQAGIVVGRADLVSEMRKHPMARALRAGAPTLSALAETLNAYAEGTAGALPLWEMAMRTSGELRERLTEMIAESGVDGSVTEGHSVIGGGSVPGHTIPTPVLEIASPGADDLWPKLLASDPAVVARREAGRLKIDLRTVDPSDDPLLVNIIREACRS